MHTIETAIVMPIIFYLAIGCISMCLRFAELAGAHAQALSDTYQQETLSNTDIARGGDVLYELYTKYARK